MEKVLRFDKLTEQHWRQLVSEEQASRFWFKYWVAMRWVHDYFRG